MSKKIFPYYTDETATAWNTPIGDYVEGQLCSTNEQLVALADELDVDVSNHIVTDIREATGIMFDRIAVVDDKHCDMLESLGRAAIEDNSCDSGWYAACENYNNVLVELAEFTLPI